MDPQKILPSQETIRRSHERATALYEQPPGNKKLSRHYRDQSHGRDISLYPVHEAPPINQQLQKVLWLVGEGEQHTRPIAADAVVHRSMGALANFDVGGICALRAILPALSFLMLDSGLYICVGCFGCSLINHPYFSSKTNMK